MNNLESKKKEQQQLMEDHLYVMLKVLDLYVKLEDTKSTLQVVGLPKPRGNVHIMEESYEVFRLKQDALKSYIKAKETKAEFSQMLRNYPLEMEYDLGLLKLNEAVNIALSFFSELHSARMKEYQKRWGNIKAIVSELAKDQKKKKKA